jgi:hypothetical protein
MSPRDNVKEARLQKQRYDRRRAAGICTRCEFAAVPGRSLCVDCLEIQTQTSRDRRRVDTQVPLPLTELPKPSKPLNGGGIKRDYLVQGWCPPKGSIALGMIWNGK